MVIYLPNEFIDPLAAYLRHSVESADVRSPTEIEANAIERLLHEIEIAKNGIPFQMWLRNKEERHVHDTVAVGADRVDRHRSARGARVRKNPSRIVRPKR